MEILRYTHVAFMIFVWAYIFIFIKPSRIKNLLPVGIIAFIVLFVAEEFIISMGLYQFNKPLINIFGTPLYHLIWSAGSGIIYMNYMKKEFKNQVLVVLLFVLFTLGFEYLAELAGVASHLDNYTEIHQFLLDLAALVILKWVSIGLLGDKIIKNNSIS